MPIAEYREWQDFAQLEPFGTHFEDLRAGQVCSVIANAHRDTKKHAAPFTPLDFLPWSDAGQQHVQPQTFADPEAHSAALMRLMGINPN